MESLCAGNSGKSEKKQKSDTTKSAVISEAARVKQSASKLLPVSASGCVSGMRPFGVCAHGSTNQCRP